MSSPVGLSAFGLVLKILRRGALVLAIAPAICALGARAQVTYSNTPPGPMRLPPLPPPPAPASPTTFPRMPDGHVDLSGVWFAGIKDLVTFDDSKIDVPLTPEYARRRKVAEDATASGNPFADGVTRCIAFGMPRMMSFNLFEILQSSKQVTVITEDLHEVRRIYVDGRSHPADFMPSYDGHSIGHWDGDTLVVDTVGLRANTFDQDGIPHSDQLHITERIRMVNPNAVINEMTMVDPKALTKPWVVMETYRRQPASTEIKEYVCDSNRNAPDASGHTTAQLGK